MLKVLHHIVWLSVLALSALPALAQTHPGTRCRPNPTSPVGSACLTEKR